MPWVRPRLSFVDRTTLRKLVALSLPMLLFQLGALLVNQLAPITVAHAAGLATVADYAVWLQLYSIPNAIVAMIDGPIVPALREALARGDHSWMVVAFRRMQRIKLAIVATCTLAFFAVGNVLVQLLSAQAVDFDWPVWAATGLLLAAAVWNTSYNDLMIATDRIWPLAFLTFANGAVTGVATYLLAHELGVAGAILGTAVFSLLIGSWVLPRLTRDIFRRDRAVLSA